MLSVNTNMGSLRAQTSLAQTELRARVTMERLSTGKRINSAADDAAGISIASRMQAHILSMQQAIRNTGDGISLAQTADGSMTTMVSILQRMRELTVQSLNGTYSTTDLTAIDTELTQLKEEFTRIADTTQWNGMPLLDGTGGDGTGKFQFLVGGNDTKNDQIDLTIPDLSTIFSTDSSGSTPTTQDIQLSITNVDDEYTILVDNVIVAHPAIGFTPDITINLSPYVKSTGSKIEAIFKNNSGSGSYAFSLAIDGAVVASQTPQSSFATGTLRDFTYNSSPDSGSETSSTRTTLAELDAAITKVITAQSTLGATINRLNYALDNATNSTTDMATSKSRIEDADFTTETSELSKDQVILQAANAMLAQANQSSKDVMTLIQSINK